MSKVIEIKNSSKYLIGYLDDSNESIVKHTVSKVPFYFLQPFDDYWVAFYNFTL